MSLESDRDPMPHGEVKSTFHMFKNNKKPSH